MKINRRAFIAAASSASVLVKSQLTFAKTAEVSETEEETFPASRSVEGKQVAVYTTAEKTDYRLSATSTLTFKPHGPHSIQTLVF